MQNYRVKCERKKGDASAGNYYRLPLLVCYLASPKTPHFTSFEVLAFPKSMKNNANKTKESSETQR
jgi:hypothetical protein